MIKKFLRVSVCVLLTLPFVVSAETITSDNFVLQNSEGNMTAQLTTSNEGTPALFIYDKNGVVRISIGLYPDGAPGVVLNDEKGLAGAIMRLVESEGNPVLVLKEDGKDRHVINVDGVVGGDAKETPLPLIALSVIFSMVGSSVITLFILSKQFPKSTTQQ